MISGKNLKEMYDNVETRKQAWEIACLAAENMIQKEISLICPDLCKEDKEDIAQNCRINIQKALANYDPKKAAFLTYCKSYLRGTVLSNAKKARGSGASDYKQKRYNLRIQSITGVGEDGPEEDYRPWMASGSDTEAETFRSIEKETNSIFLYCHMNKLPEKQRKALKAIDIQGLSISEYAAEINATYEYVVALHSNAFKSLCRELGAPEPSHELDRTGEKMCDRLGRPLVIVHYGGCKNIEAIMNDHGTYYRFTGTTYDKLKRRDLLRKNCSVKCTRIDPDTLVKGRPARSYFSGSSGSQISK